MDKTNQKYVYCWKHSTKCSSTHTGGNIRHPVCLDSKVLAVEKIETTLHSLLLCITWSSSSLNCSISNHTSAYRRSQRPRGLRRRFAAARLLRSWVRIPPGACVIVYSECCVLSGRGLCDELITRPEESYRLWCVVVCDLETSRKRRPWPTKGSSHHKNK